MTGVLAGYTYIITVVPVNILGDGYPNKTIGYLNIIIIKYVMFTSHIVIIPKRISSTSTTVDNISKYNIMYRTSNIVIILSIVTTCSLKSLLIITCLDSTYIYII